MANWIKGLTVEIDGSTTGLDKAKNNVNTTIKGTHLFPFDLVVDKFYHVDLVLPQLLVRGYHDFNNICCFYYDALQSMK